MMIKKILFIFFLTCSSIISPTVLYGADSYTTYESYDTSTDNVTQVSNAVKEAIDSVRGIYANILWVVSFLVFLTMIYAGSSTYFRIKEKKEQGQHIPALYKFTKILTNVVLVLFMDYVVLGIFAITFANSDGSTPVTFNATWNAIVTSYFMPIFH